MHMQLLASDEKEEEGMHVLYLYIDSQLTAFDPIEKRLRQQLASSPRVLACFVLILLLPLATCML